MLSLQHTTADFEEMQETPKPISIFILFCCFNTHCCSWDKVENYLQRSP